MTEMEEDSSENASEKMSHWAKSYVKEEMRRMSDCFQL